MTLYEAVQRLLSKRELRYRHVGMGEFACTSCGAAAYEDYSDGAKEVVFSEEPHSTSCPWKQLIDAAESGAPPTPETKEPTKP